MPEPQIAGYIISLITLVVYVFVFKQTNYTVCPIIQKRRSVLAYVTGAILILYSVYPRAFFPASITAGTFIFEEIGASIIYISKLFYTGEQTYSGATQIVYAVVFDWWRTLWGTSVFAARALSGVICAIGIVIYYFAFKKILNKNVALIIAALLSASLYATFFAHVAIETGWALTVLALNIYIAAKLVESKKNLALYFAFGLSLALGILTYPGYSLGLVAFALSAVLTLFIFKKSYLRPRSSDLILPSIMVVFGLTVLILPSYIFHYTKQGQAPFLFGGGVLAEGSMSYLDSLWVQVRDIFIGGQSYYLPFREFGFVESSLFGFFIISVWIYVIKKRAPLYTFSFLSCITIPFLVAIARNYPGMRRGIMFLTPFYFLAGVGVYIFICAIEDCSSRAKQLFGFITLILLILYSVYAGQKTLEPSNQTRPYSQLNEVLLKPEFQTALIGYNVLLIIDKLSEFDAEYAQHSVYLFNRYNNPPFDLSNSLNIYDAKSELKIKTERRNLIITNLPEIITRYQSNKSVCVSNPQKLNTFFYPFYVAEIAQANSPLCPAH